MAKAIFFDRDGTINVDKNYLYKIEEFEFLPKVPEVLSKMKKRGYLLILITNQSGIARGYYTVGQMNDLHRYMQNELKKYNAEFDAIFFCPHYPQGIISEYAIECGCRKPGDLLFEQAIKRYDIVPNKSIAIGDKDRDLIPAERLGIKCIKISDEEDCNWNTCQDFEQLLEFI